MRRSIQCILVLVTVCAIAGMAEAGMPERVSSPPAHPVAGLIDEVQELCPDAKLDHPAKTLTVHVARNSIAGVHVMIAGLRGTETIRFAEAGAGGRSHRVSCGTG